uniref:Photosynthesis system II assembly factor Ycf48/Hcf136-like domain-containing protein n=1 Tax=Candidatus Kentrum sp. MB TaxID=2138164 RepID=A0A450XY09_9GAMM|nr:MAG: Uncharacterized protein BECKMB1821G_GA0114241_106116 [Candidatus Kentron sp. MB]VFK34179.1 MAG: Uncharacterized protein BECKMB1821I_GA0114274_106316 [Candidatus Kentron sp. MB]VFK76721.1 MAG: Uncharacterized protein BECKMB1821H_GA0114242_10714 [Candidatus Kentron sp. MB]
MIGNPPYLSSARGKDPGFRCALRLCCGLFLAVIWTHNWAEDGVPVPENSSWSWFAPLAEKSLLLAVGKFGERMIAVGERGHILYKQGQTPWRQGDVPTQLLLTGLSFSDERHGFAVGHDALILATSDGGQSWRKAHEAIGEQRPLLDIRFWNNLSGIAVGAYGYLLRTEDGGESWHSGVVHRDHDFHLNAIAIAPDRIYLAAEAGFVYRSDDQGHHWKVLDPPYDGSFSGIHAIDDNKVMVFGLRGHLFVSEDAGEHWRALATGVQSTLTSAITLDNGQFLVIGHGGTLLLVDSSLRRVHRAQLFDRKALSDAVQIGPNRILSVGEGGIRVIDLYRVFMDALVDRRRQDD